VVAEVVHRLLVSEYQDEPTRFALRAEVLSDIVLFGYVLKMKDLYRQTDRQTDSELSLLHFAPEQCLKLRFEKIFGTDYMTGDIEPGRAKKVVDITNICFESESYNYVICNHVLEHIPDDHKALSELYRVLKKGGTAYLSVPIKDETTEEDLSVVDPDERIKRFGQFDHVRYYGMDFKTRIEFVGFHVSVITPKDVIKNEKLRKLFGINVTEGNAGNILFVAKKI
jgi:SAM-dependent methyltransferase